MNLGENKMFLSGFIPVLISWTVMHELKMLHLGDLIYFVLSNEKKSKVQNYDVNAK